MCVARGKKICIPAFISIWKNWWHSKKSFSSSGNKRRPTHEILNAPTGIDPLIPIYPRQSAVSAFISEQKSAGLTANI